MKGKFNIVISWEQRLNAVLSFAKNLKNIYFKPEGFNSFPYN